MSSVPQPSPGAPTPIEVPPVEAPPDQTPPPEIDEPPAEPRIPVREPGVTTPARAWRGFWTTNGDVETKCQVAPID